MAFFDPKEKKMNDYLENGEYAFEIISASKIETRFCPEVIVIKMKILNEPYKDKIHTCFLEMQGNRSVHHIKTLEEIMDAIEMRCCEESHQLIGKKFFCEVTEYHGHKKVYNNYKNFRSIYEFEKNLNESEKKVDNNNYKSCKEALEFFGEEDIYHASKKIDIDEMEIPF